MATKFQLDVDARYGVKDEGDLAYDFFHTLSNSVAESVDNALSTIDMSNTMESPTTGEMRSMCNNGLVVVNWKHSRIPNLSAALGCGKEEGCPKKYHSQDFDTIWLLTFQYSVSVEESHSLGYLKNSPITLRGDWKISNELVNEGFGSNNTMS